MSLSIYSAFDGGNIDVVDATNTGQIQLKIRPDAGDRHFQWFYYQVCDAAGMDLSMVIENAGETSFAQAFKGYQAVASQDQVHWFRVPTEFDGQRLTIEHTPEADIVYYAFFEPYSHIRHLALLAEAQASEAVSIESLCATPDGHAHSLITATESTLDDPTIVWVTARQHPGEPMAQWWVEGFLDRLLDSTDAVSRALLAQCVFYIVPNMCIDGSIRGHLRCNATGANLNREWAEPSPERSPEVFYVRQKMEETGIDIALDVHGDEALPYNFFAGAEGTASWDEKKQADFDRFKQILAELSPDFQTEFGYEIDPPNSSDLKKCTDYLSETFNCLAVTLEMPFKDAANSPVPETGWDGMRSAQFGRAMVDALWAYIRPATSTQ